MAPETSNPLLSTKTSDSGLHAHLHPLVLLTISDLIARRSLRQQDLPVVGVLFGQQNGRDISLEYATECQIATKDDGTFILHDEWSKDRVQQYKDVHKAPALEVVGWFTTAPVSGPERQHLEIQEQMLHSYNETALLLAFHPASVLEGAGVGGKLPLTIYESVYESSQEGGKSTAQAGNGIEDKMDIEGQEGQLELKFRDLPYTVETGEAEMISVDYIARGAGNATAVDGIAKSASKGQASQTPVGALDPKKVGKAEGKTLEDSTVLLAEEEELIMSLTARANAVKMLHTRIQLLKTYLQNLPPSYLTTENPSDSPNGASSKDRTEIDHPILRSIQALVNRLPLLTPADQGSFAQEQLAEQNDVSLVSLLGSLSSNVRDAQETGRKFGVVDQARHAKSRTLGFGGQMGPHGLPLPDEMGDDATQLGNNGFGSYQLC